MHKAECKSLVSIHPHSPSDTMRLVLRVLQRKKVKLKKKGKSSTSQEERTVSAQGREIDFLCSSERPHIPPNVVVFFVFLFVFFCFITL